MATDLLGTLRQHSALPAAAFRLIQAGRVDVSAIERGILFVFAAWSGPAQMFFKSFTKALSEMDLKGIEVMILDADEVDSQLARELIGPASFTMGGGGEAFWVRGGRVRHLGNYRTLSPELVRAYTEEILEAEFR